MTIQYFTPDSKRTTGRNIESFNYSAINDAVHIPGEDEGPSTDIYHPAAYVRGVYEPGSIQANFDNRTSSGYTDHAIGKVFTKLSDEIAHTGNTESLSEASGLWNNMARGQAADKRLGHSVDKRLGYGYSHDDNELSQLQEQGRVAAHKAGSNPYFQQDTLFDETPSKVHISSMFSDPSMTSSAMTMVSLAKNKFNAQNIEADYSLSNQSSKLVKNAVKRGLVTTHPDNPTAAISNNIISQPVHEDASYLRNVQHERLPDHEVSAANSSLRAMIRGNRPRNTKPVTSKGLSDQFLPGMEGFV